MKDLAQHVPDGVPGSFALRQLSIILSRRTRLPYVGCRVLTDTVSVLLCMLLGGVIGVGTLICAVGLGPVIAFFNRAVSRRLTGVD